ncbi:MAG: hypothetical protein J7K04_04750 [Spirochaetales bacterium]|nr:hypothetical protein [Spirochaetales bacterium]
MTERDNLIRTVNFEKPDHIHMTFHINASCWEHYSNDELQDLMENHPFLFPDFKRQKGPVKVNLPSFLKSDKEYTDPWGCVWKTTMNGIQGTVIKHPIETWDNFSSYKPPDPDHFTHWGPISWKKQAKEIGPSISQHSIKNGEIGHNHTWLKLNDIRGYENSLYDMVDGEPNLIKLLGMLEDFNMGLLRNYLKIGVEWMTFSEDLGMQVGPMLSPELFRKYIKPSYQKLMGTAKQEGCIVHVHADGDLRDLMDDLFECSIDIINLQDLVNGIDWIEKNIKGKICIELDIDRQEITFEGTQKQIDDLIKLEVEKLGSREGGLMMIYGLYPGVPIENAKAVMDAMERYAGYYR